MSIHKQFEYTSDIKNIIGIQFSVLNSEEILKRSVANIYEPTLYDSNGEPKIGGLFDPRMGIIERNKNEIVYCKKKSNIINCYSKRFAAKEAFVKALGIGFRKNINFKDIEVLNNHYGMPHLFINKKVVNKIKILFKVKKFNVFLSISDEKKYAIASVIISN